MERERWGQLRVGQALKGPLRTSTSATGYQCGQPLVEAPDRIVMPVLGNLGGVEFACLEPGAMPVSCRIAELQSHVPSGLKRNLILAGVARRLASDRPPWRKRGKRVSAESCDDE